MLEKETQIKIIYTNFIYKSCCILRHHFLESLFEGLEAIHGLDYSEAVRARGRHLLLEARLLGLLGSSCVNIGILLLGFESHVGLI